MLAVLGLLGLSLAAQPALAPTAEDGWLRPPQEVVDLATADPTPSVDIAPDGRWMLLVERDAMPELAELARPMLRLAGMRIDPSTNGPHRAYTSKGLLLRPLAGGEERRIALPPGAKVGDISWAYDGQRFAYTLVTDDGTELWVCDAESGVPRRVLKRLNAVFGGFSWMPDAQRIVCLAVPEGRGEAPAEPRVPEGPAIEETRGKTSPVRTYQDLLEDPHDAALFEYYATSQVVLIDAAGGAPTELGKPDIYMGAGPSPDGQSFLVRRIGRPFSYLFPVFRFPMTIEVWNAAGEKTRLVARIPLVEDVPIGGVRTGPRSVGWQPTADATVQWVEALDGGDPEREAEHRDRWMRWDLHQPGAPTELCRLEQRSRRGLTWFADGGRFLASDYDRDRRWVRTLLLDAADPGVRTVLDDRNQRDSYNDPGRVLTAPNERGRRVVVQDGERIYRSGQGASREGARPFLDRHDLATGESERLWRCATDTYEFLVDLVEHGEEGQVAFVTRHESPTEPPNWRLHRTGGGEDVSDALTAFPDPTPQLRGITKKLVRYERGDGVELSATLYLPAGYQEGTKLPLVVWAYPMEYSDPSTAGQVRGTPYRFTRMAGISHLFFLTQGYAVMDGATMPVIGDPETVNDTFLVQIVGAARAAIDEAVKLGVSDGQRVGVGGHSYGAFMTANLLAHCDLFRAGVARSGAYNRTLTPFGFQAERRTLWEAPEIYFAISPFMHADEIDEPLLLIHGAADNNSGTFPIQSERLFHAVKGHGGTARLVMLPHEGHGYRARESVLHTLAEMFAWFDEHVKAAPVREAGFRTEPGEDQR